MTERILRALLRLAPDDFRERYGAELLEVHRRRTSTSSPGLSRLFFSMKEILGLCWTLLRLRLGRGHDARTTTTRTTTGGAPMLDTARQDLRFATRTLGRNPGFSATAITVLALGIGANAAIFSAVNAFFFRPLPFGDADRLVMLYETNPEFGWEHQTAAPANGLDWREEVDAFQDLALYTEWVSQVPYLHDGEPEIVGVNSVTGNFFSVLGVRPALGPGFDWEDTWEGNDDVVVLSHGFWLSRFGGDPDVVGRTMEFGITTVEIVGVMPAGFTFPDEDVQLWTPWGWAPENREAVWFRRAHWVRPMARLAPGVTPEEADAELQVVVRRLQEDYPETNAVMGAGLMPLRDFLVMDVRRSLLILLGAVGLLLLLACTNVANLMLVRASERGREVALRFALGAGRGRVVRQMMTESLLLGLVGGGLGLGLGWVGIRTLTGSQEIGVTGATSLALDWRVVLFTLGAAVLSALFFGVAPALRATGGRVREALNEGGRGGSAGAGTLRTVSGLVTAEVALALVLVIGAGLMIRSFVLLRDVDPGFRTDGVLAVQFSLPSSRYESRDRVLAFQDEFQARLEGRGGILSVGLVARLPLDGTNWTSQFQARDWPPEQVGFDIIHRRADRGYFEALDIPLVRGRLFGPDDGPDAPPVVVVNETFTREYFPGQNPVGRQIAFDRNAVANAEEATWLEIVGVVGDQHQLSPGQPTRPEVFESRRQDWGRFEWFVIRTSGEAMAGLPVARQVLAEMDPLIPIAEARPLRDVWQASMAREEFILTLLGVFGAVALILAAVGIYGVTAQAAKRRTQEIGIRMALGAGPGDVLSMMLRQGLGVVGLGLVLGLAGALAATRVMESLLYGVAPTDPATFAGVVGLLGAVAAAACYVPARRATAVDPVRSLRAE